MYSITKTGGNVNSSGILELIADTVQDIQNLPHITTPGKSQDTNTKEKQFALPGSTCYCVENNSTYILTNADTWVIKPSATSGSGSEGGTVDLSNYLAKDNAMEYVPTADYNPATKKYVDDNKFSGKYSDLSGAPTIPSKVSELENDLAYSTENYVDEKYETAYETLTGFAKSMNELSQTVEMLRKSLSTSTAVLVPGESIANKYADENINTIALIPGTFSNQLDLTRSIKLTGYNSDVVANTGDRCSDVIGENESIINGAINISGNSDVVLEGLTFTENALIEIENNGSLTLTNCKIVNVTPNAAKTFIVKSTQSNPIKLTIENCYFGSNTTTSTGNVYNGLELNCTLKDGSSISNNYCAAAVCTHNMINIYAVEEGATIYINNNHFEYSANAIRIGVKGEPNCTIVCDGNAYDATDTTYPDYAGLLLVQPYGKQTTSFANCTIKIDNTIHSDDEQLYYLYAGAGDMQFTDSNKPTIIVDGITEVQPTQDSIQE